MTRILIVDDHTLFRESLCRLLNGESTLRVVGEYASADPALRDLAAGLAFDVALIDYDLPASGGIPGSGLALCEAIATQHPTSRLLMVTAGMPAIETQYVIHTLKIGLFLKTEPIAELLLAIQRTAHGEQWLSSAAALSLLRAPEPRSAQRGFNDLSSRERSVLRFVLEGLTNKEISHRLDISESVVKATLQRLFEHTGVRSRSQLVRIAIEQQVAFD